LQTDPDRAFKLITVEVFTAAIGFDHDQIAQLHAFICCETSTTGGAKTTAPNGNVVFGGAGIFDLCVNVSAKGATHGPVLVLIYTAGCGYFPTSPQ
jgi:hypothetical protein